MSLQRHLLPVLILPLFLPFISGCIQEKGRQEGKETVIIFKHGKIAGDPEPFRQLLDRFEKENPGIKVNDETLPASTDEQHQFYAINLEGRSSDFDVLSMDVIWVPEFARAGWLMDLGHLIQEGERDEFFPGPMHAVTYNEKIYAIPWYIDAGLLYYRKDILDKYGFLPPKIWDELVHQAKTITKNESDLYGFIWQGKQYEGLVCNVLEYFWSNGGDVIRGREIVVNSIENVTALRLMRDLIVTYAVTPPLVTTAIEEPTRHIFGNGRAIFMRNWPYAWNIFEREGSPVKGKVGISTLPSFPGKESASTLGGWQLGINRYSRHPDAAERLIRFLTSYEAQKTFALTIGYKPTRKSLYRDRDLMKEQPFITGLYDVFMKARPRPVTPYYMMVTQVMQPEFSAALSGIKTPEEALSSVQRQIEHIMGVAR
ncbi:MAG TPA: sugar ABC transporter substrate-binding protein [Deltaproteobacteria bacterium]|nr:sugar ABC transporter substrate-binding protein [Deltaproteobacteria bacterium]